MTSRDPPPEVQRVLDALRAVDVNKLRLGPTERRVLRGCEFRLAHALVDLGVRAPSPLHVPPIPVATT